MAHGFLGFKDWAFFPWLAGFLAESGFPAVRFNFSGSGMGPQTDGPFENLEAFENDSITQQVEDLHSVIACVAAGKLEPDLSAQKDVLLWGHSRGGAVCFLAAAHHPYGPGRGHLGHHRPGEPLSFRRQTSLAKTGFFAR